MEPALWAKEWVAEAAGEWEGDRADAGAWAAPVSAAAGPVSVPNAGKLCRTSAAFLGASLPVPPVARR
jgi:hypothetical protein